MPHLLQIFMSLRLILFLLNTYGYMITVVAHTYVLNLPSELCLNLDDFFYGLALKRTLV